MCRLFGSSSIRSSVLLTSSQYLPHTLSSLSYDALQREKESLEEAIETLRAQLMAREGGGEGGGNGEGKGSKQLKMLQKIIRNLEVS